MAKLTLFYQFLVVILSSTAVFGTETIPKKKGTCQDLCASTFQEDEQTYCMRGCRFASLIDLVSGSELSLEDVQKACFKACSDSYGMRNDSSCAFGCTGQLPTVEDKRKELAKYFLDMNRQAQTMFDIHSQFSEYAQRMMDCMFEQLNHQFNYGWVVVSESSSVSNDNGRVIIVRGVPEVRVFRPVSQDQGVIEASVSFSKKDNHDTGAGKGIMVVDRTAAYHSSKKDWFSCLSAELGVSRFCLSIVMFVMATGVVWILFCMLCPFGGQHQLHRKHEKLSIYGDSEGLVPLSEKSSEVFAGLQKYEFSQAPPLPIKSQVL